MRRPVEREAGRTSSRKKVVVIGAGPCGLVALKEQLEAGHEATCFEQASQLGGVFSSSATYPGLHLTISNWLMAFSDFPDPARLHYPTADHYLAYLQSYTKHFELEKHIQYDVQVMNAELDRDGRWDIRLQEVRTQEVMEVKADALIVATGANHVPREVPQNLAGFEGRIMHSVEYNKEFKEEVANKQLRVLLVGGGESAADISAELSELSPNVTAWFRRPFMVAPRYLNPWREMPQVELNKTEDFGANSYLEAVTTNRMSATQNIFFYGLFRRILWWTPFLLPTLSSMNLQGAQSAIFSNDQAGVVTKNQRMCEAIEDAKLRAIVCPKATATHGRTCVFEMPGGRMQKHEFDVLLLCTGFQTLFPWLKAEGVEPDPRSWFLHCFPKGWGDRLFFVGYARPHQGGIPACAEILSRYIALLLKGERQLPADYASMADEDAVAERDRFCLRRDLSTLVDYNTFMESVGRRIGCEPQLPRSCVVAFNIHMLALCMWVWYARERSITGCLLAFGAWLTTLLMCLTINDSIMYKWWFFAHWPVWYRQRGPGADAALLRGILQQVGMRKRTNINRRSVLFFAWTCLTFYAQRFLSVPVFLVDRIRRALGWPFLKAWGGQFRPKYAALHSAEWRVSDLCTP